eukprot:scaffold1.g5385.t1
MSGFQAAVREHKLQEEARAKRSSDAQTRASYAAQRLVAVASRHINAGAQQCHEQQRAIGAELKAVRGQAGALAKTAARLNDAVNKAESAALQFGDLETYLAAIEREAGAIAAALRRVQQQELRQQQERRQGPS